MQLCPWRPILPDGLLPVRLGEDGLPFANAGQAAPFLGLCTRCPTPGVRLLTQPARGVHLVKLLTSLTSRTKPQPQVNHFG